MLTAFVSAVVLKGLVSLSVPGLPVRDAVALIAEQTGEDLRVRDDANLNTLVIDVDGVELDALLKKIADVTGARWQVEGERKTLVTDDDTNALLEKRESAACEAVVARALDALPKADGPLSKIEIEGLVARAEEIGKSLEVWIPDDTQRSVLASIRESRPVTRLARQAAKLIGAAGLAEVAPGQKRVYSTAPVGSETKLPGSATEALRAYASEYAHWRGAVASSVAVHPVKNPEDPRFGLVREGEPSLLLVEVSRPIELPRITVVVRVADAGGNVLESGFQPLSLAEVAESVRVEPDIAFEPPRRLREVQALLTFADFVSTATGPVAVSDGVREMLRDPVGHDPVALGAGPLLIAMSRAAGANLVACVPDTALDWYYRRQGAVPERWTVNAALSEVGSQWQCDAQIRDSWATVVPKWITDARRRYFARGPLKALILKQRAERFVSHETAREYASSQRSNAAFRSYDSRVVLRLMTYSGNVADAHLIHWENEGPLRILGTMNDAEIALAREGVRVSTLNERAQRSIVEWMAGPASVAQWFRTEEEEYGLANVGLMSHRVLSRRVDLVLRIAEPTEPMSFQLWPDAKLPFADLMEWSGRVYEEAVEPTNGMKVQVGVLRRVRLRLEAAGVGFVSYDIEQAAAPPGDKWLLPRDLPEEDLRLFKEAYDRSKGGSLTPPLLGRATRTS